MEDVVGHAAGYLEQQEVHPGGSEGLLSPLLLDQVAEYAQQSLKLGLRSAAGTCEYRQEEEIACTLCAYLRPVK